MKFSLVTGSDFARSIAWARKQPKLRDTLEMTEQIRTKIRLTWLENLPGATIENYKGRWHFFAQGRSFEAATFMDVIDAAYDALVLEPQRKDTEAAP